MLLMFDSKEDFERDKFYIFIFNTLFTVINFYIFFSLIIPQLLNRKKIAFLVLIAVSFLVFYPLLQYNIFSFLRDNVNINWRRLKYKDYFLSQAYSTTALYTGLAFLARFTIKWVSEKQKQAELINQNQTSELALLRSQINPHFLFNTLNNIYSLVLKKSENAPEAMMKLSEILRYMLYETNSDRVPLEKEVKYLESYRELMQLRLKEKHFIAFEVKGDISKLSIPPMLLVPFVENAFKHCRKQAPSPGVTISLVVEGHKMDFRVVNYKKEDCLGEETTPGGIGLANIKRRLELLYPRKHKLEITEPGDRFEVRLEVLL
jgi:two-component system, LytTR family, sensor kinase